MVRFATAPLRWSLTGIHSACGGPAGSAGLDRGAHRVHSGEHGSSPTGDQADDQAAASSAQKVVHHIGLRRAHISHCRNRIRRQIESEMTYFGGRISGKFSVFFVWFVRFGHGQSTVYNHICWRLTINDNVY